MGRLRGIDIVRISAIKADDRNEDEVYYLSFLDCDASGGGEPVGGGDHAPERELPRPTKEMHRAPAPLECRQGEEMSPSREWGRLFPVRAAHELCCDDTRRVSGSVYFFDSDDPHIGVKIFGAILITLLSAAVAIVIALAFPPLSFKTVVMGVAGGVALWAALAMAWQQFIHIIGRSDYLGGIRISFPCEGSAAIEETHDLQGASAGIRSAKRPGRPRAQWSGSSAEYRVTFRATYG